MAEKTLTVVNKNIRCGKGDFLFDEAFNSLAVNLKYIAKQDGCAVISVTSYFSGEGKSTVSYNLAYTIAQQGKKVLLVDADLRRGRLHRYFDAERVNGLTDYLCGLKKSDEIIRKSAVEGLDYISAGATTMSPIRLLERKEFDALIEKVRAMYDWVVIDCAPIGMVSDSLLVMRVVDGAVVVLDQNKSRKHDVDKAVEMLNVSKVDILGFVINQAEDVRVPKARGKYSRYERYGYLNHAVELKKNKEEDKKK